MVTFASCSLCLGGAAHRDAGLGRDLEQKREQTLVHSGLLTPLWAKKESFWRAEQPARTGKTLCTNPQPSRHSHPGVWELLKGPALFPGRHLIISHPTPTPAGWVSFLAANSSPEVPGEMNAQVGLPNNNQRKRQYFSNTPDFGSLSIGENFTGSCRPIPSR